MKSFNLLTACALGAMLLTGCSDDGVGGADAPDAVDGSVTFRLGMGVVTQAPPASRALAHEQGFDYENTIDDAVVIVYDTPLNATGGSIVYSKYLSSVTSDGSFSPTVPINATSYDASGNGTTWSTVFSAVNRYTFELGEELGNSLEDGKTYYILALANVGDLMKGDGNKHKPVTTLNDLRDYVYYGPICTFAGYTDNKKGLTQSAISGTYPENGHFAMSAIGEQKFTYRKTDITNSVYTLPDVYVQRLAARVDLIFGRKGNSVAQLADSNYDYVILDSPGEYPYDSNQFSVYFPIYDAEKGSRISGAVFVMDEVYLWNTLDDITGEYLFERNDYNGVKTIFGIEEFNTETGYATHFVYSPPFMKGTTEVPEGSSESHNSYAELFPNKYGTWAKSEDTRETRDGLIGDPNRVRTLSDGTEYVILGYVRENTFKTHSDNNRYTEVNFAGRSNLSNGHFTGSSVETEDGKYVTVLGSIPVRHSTGKLDTTKPLAYGIVRNTIYRIGIKFFAKGETIYARYYYYGTKFDGSDDKVNPDENKYTDIPFHNYVLEGDGKTPND